MTGFFKHCGFTAYAEEQTRGEAVYIPMERMISPSQVKPQGKKNRAGFGPYHWGGRCCDRPAGRLRRFSRQESSSRNPADKAKKTTESSLPSKDAGSRPDDDAQDEEDYGNDGSDDGQKEATVDEVELEDIEAYVAENLPYEVAEET